MDLGNASGDASIGLLKDDQPSTWQAMVLEVVLVRYTMVGKRPLCTSQNFTSITGWYELAERAGVIGFNVWTPRLGTTMSLEGPEPMGCLFRRREAAGGLMARVVDRKVTPKNLHRAESMNRSTSMAFMYYRGDSLLRPR